MSNDRRAAVKKLRNLYLSPKIDINDFRSRIDETFSSVFLPNNVELEETAFRLVKCDVISPEVFASNRILLYIHGGSFVGGSRKAYRPFVAALANATASKAYLPDFRLAPAHPYPAGLEDIQQVFQALYIELETALSLNVDSNDSSRTPEILIMADTSGASLAMALLYGLNDKFRESVRQVVLFSPWLDFSEKNDMFTSKKVSDEVFTADSVRLASEHYTYQENWKNPLVSPLMASGDMLRKMPPVFIQMGEKEIFYDDAVMFQAMLRNFGGVCELDVWPKMMPMFQLADEFLSEAHLAVEKIGQLITAKDRSDEGVHEILLKLERN
ncbi:MAG: alpha/beta hydrolase fold domain-containing protein [Treponema sp.]|uniref:alpha/beta hydrolase fold domain-containing protein n=1 Tax=Treponema sp. TaxID=166 RepID=UPI001B51DEDB|nr:alpha/beta hydrolase fold domain-containing protein [Treponema sp.]MBP3772519.1 alpha/beta hydrolase fold domain-containing protein [Treponema sp.]MBQ9281436.1 alpha/beta hydrolase fold domain-containing protein [Treponema sp.]